MQSIVKFTDNSVVPNYTRRSSHLPIGSSQQRENEKCTLNIRGLFTIRSWEL